MAVLTSVLVIGPTGSVGTAVCNALIERKALFKRIAAFNNTDRPAGAAKQAALDALANDGMEIVSGTYGDVEAFKGFDAVLMPLGNFGNFLQTQVIDTAVAAGVRHFYPSEFGADITVGENWTQRYYRDKVLTREHLHKRDAELGQRGEGLGWSYVCIGRFTEWSIYPRFGWNHVDHTAEVYGNENGRQSLICLKDVAALTVLTLLDPFDPKHPASRQRTYRFASSSPTWKELFAIMEQVTGKPYKVTYRPVSEVRELEARAKAANDEQLETAASHRLVQGTEGTLLPQPWDNSKFRDQVAKVVGVEAGLKKAWQDDQYRKAYGL